MRVMHRLERYAGFHLFVIQSRALNPDPPDDCVPDGCSVRVLTQSELIQFSRNPELSLDRESIVKALARGDVCVGYVDHGELVAYLWGGRAATPAEAGLWVRFGDGYSYGYKALTVPSHQGRHLQERLIHVKDRWLTAHGSRYNINHIRTDNFPSIVADRRYGNRPVGYAGYVKWFGRVWTFHSPAVKARGFRFFAPDVRREDASS